MAKNRAISVATSGDTTIIAAPNDDAHHKVIGYTIVAAAATTAQFSTTGGTDLTGVMTLATGVPNSGGWNAGDFIWKLPDGEGLVLTLGGAVQVSGFLSYFGFERQV